MSRRDPALVAAAAFHFGSYRLACERAGLDYSTITRRPRWTKPKIIRLLKAAYRSQRDLRWSAVTARRDDLARAAFASLQPRLFGSWNRALHAAGLDSGDIAQYRTWNRATIVSDLRQLHADNEPLNSRAVQIADPGLHAAAIRHFKTYAKALRAAGVNPTATRLRRSWTPEDVLTELRKRKKRRLPTNDAAIRKENPALYGAALRLFGNFPTAHSKANLTP
jgi:hypothetical protein